MMKKLTFLVALMVVGMVFVEAYAQRGAGAGNQRMAGTQRQRGGQVDVAAIVAFLNQNGLQAQAKGLAAMENDPAKAAEFRALSQQYNAVMREMQRDPAAGKLSVDKLKCEAEIARVLPGAKSGNAQAKTALTTQVGKLFDVIIAQQEALAAAEELSQSPGGQQRQMMAGAGNFQRMGRVRGLTPEQKAELTKNIALWKKNKAAIVKARVAELLLPYPRLPW
ncbi:MAG: hypothetical protein GY869_08195 [Planctomycetes bacterium]|nr:hypothetical protein [Planctomycetota bacterium]